MALAAPTSPPPLRIHTESPAISGPAAAHLEQIAQARQLAKPLRRGTTIATFGGWCTAVFAALTLATGLFSIPSLLLGSAMAIVSFGEFDGARRLRRLDPAAPRRLAFNQLFFGAGLFIYAAWSMYSSLTGPSAYAQALASSPEAARLLGPIDQLTRALTLLIYGVLMLVAIFVQGGTALFYFSRRAVLDRYRTQVARWIIDLEQSGMRL